MGNIWIRAQLVCQLWVNPNLISPTERLSDVSLELIFPHPIPAQFSLLVPLLFLPTPRALISLPSQVSSIRLLAVFCPSWPSASEASRLPQNLGHRTGTCTLTHPRWESIAAWGPSPGVSQATHYLPWHYIPCAPGRLPRRPNFTQGFQGWS